MREFILGTDWWTDCDDAVAIRLLTNFHRQGKIRLLGICVNACMEASVRSLDVFIRDNGVSVPVGLDREATDFGGQPPYQRRLASLPAELDNEKAENPVRLYRRLLAMAANKVEILEIGYPQVLAALLASSADDVSTLTGKELVQAKVSHLWMMAGKWDGQDERENNFARNRRASVAASYLCANWPTEVTFLGWEVGATVISGGKVSPDDILKQVLADHGSANGRSSWDPMLVLLAMAGSPEAAGYDAVRGRAEVRAEDGHNWFYPNADGRHRYVVKKLKDADYAAMIDSQLRKWHD